MAKRPSKNDAGGGKPPINKPPFDEDAFLESEGLNNEPKDKELTWLPLSKAWFDALGIPGFPRGFVSLVRGFSNTGKSTAFYEAIAGAQKIGDYPIVIETEGNWSAIHAKQVGVKFKEEINEETGEVKLKPDGFMLVRNKDLYARYKNYCHKDSKMKTEPTRNQPVIEDVAMFIEGMIQKQTDGLLPKNICFIWDSIGTLNGYQSATANGRNAMWNANAMNVFGTIVNFLIPSSRAIDSPYINTFISVQKIWLDNMNGSVIKHKGGEFMYYSCRLNVHLGGVLTHGTTKLKATSLGQDFQYGVQAKIKCDKNHVNGIEKMGEIASTPFGYANPKELDVWKKEHRKFIHDSLNVSYDSDIEYGSEEGEFEGEDIKD
jgi:hypothetical protein